MTEGWDMDKYEELEMEVIAFEAEDVIATSGGSETYEVPISGGSGG